MAKSKATKRFERNHLKDTLQRRKDIAKDKQRHNLKEKKKAKRKLENGNSDVAETNLAERPAKKTRVEEDAFNSMTVDDLFAGAADSLVDLPKSKSEKGRHKVKATQKEGKTSSQSNGASPKHVEGADANSVDGEEDRDESDDEVNLHVDELKALAKKDPEFYKYLQENDEELLEFAENADLADVVDLSGDEEEKPKDRKGKKAAALQDEDVITNAVTKATVDKWAQAMKNEHSLRSMREVVLAFRAAAHLNEEDGKEYKYTIGNADVYHEILVCTLTHVPTVLAHHIPVQELPNGRVRVSTESRKFQKASTLLKSHTMAMQHMLENLSDAGPLKMTLQSLSSILPYILSFKKLLRELSRSVVEIWADSAHDEATRITAFLLLRRLAVIGDSGVRENVLRTAYQGLIKGSRNTTVHTISGINLMKNSAVELWGLVDADVAYTTGFTMIRQLAIHLRKAMKNNSNDSYKTIYNWQYVHSLDFWSRALATHCESLKEAMNGKESPLRPLIYPTVQITLGTMRLIPTASYFPLRFQLIRALIRLSQNTNTFIPLAAPLYEVLQSVEMKRPPKPSTLKALDFDTSIRVNKAYLRTRVYQDGVGEQVVELLSEFFTLWCKNIAFPELSLAPTVMLRRWLKEVSTQNKSAKSNGHGKKGKRDGQAAGGNRNNKVNGSVALLVQKLEANSRFIGEKRAKVEFAPNNRAGVEAFLKELEWTKTPLGAFVEGQRKQREERRRVMEEARKKEEAERREEEEEERKGNRGEFGDESDDDEESGEEEENEYEYEDEMEDDAGGDLEEESDMEELSDA